jgi:hypothetical protein
MKYTNVYSSPILILSLCIGSGVIFEANSWAQEPNETDADNSSENNPDTKIDDSSLESSDSAIDALKDGSESTTDSDENTSDSTMDSESEITTDEKTEIPEDSVANPSTTVDDSSESEPSIDISNAESLDTNLTKKQIKWLQPTRGKLPQNPYQHVDFTAYTLEWGELQAGLNRSSLGILPRTQIGTQVPLWALGLQNVNAKVNVLRVGPLDLAITGDYLSLDQAGGDGLNIQYYGIGAYTSFRIVDSWSIHAGGQYAQLNIDGFPDLDALSAPFIRFGGLTEDDISTITNAIEEAVTYTRSERILTAKIATDVRLNRRDSFIIQGNYMQSTNSTPGVEVEVQGYGLDLNSEDISSPLFRYLLIPQETSVNYGASLAYQASFKRAYLRLGVGFSNIPYSWLLQSIDLTWRWGGKTKRRANDIEKLWKNKTKSQ